MANKTAQEKFEALPKEVSYAMREYGVTEAELDRKSKEIESSFKKEMAAGKLRKIL